jgi:23S rRNA C2498 (ribose-2'-O)-methylase RlmM
MGPLDPGSPNKYCRSLASNLRGRTLQLFPPLRAATAEAQNPDEASLFCLVGKEGLFCGMQSPRAANGFHPGGTKFIGQDSLETISRAGAKIAEALHYLLMYRPPLPAGSHWLELGASPGGMTSELLARDYRVTAVDRAPLDKRLERRPGLTFVRADAAAFLPQQAARYDALLSDLNGDARESIRLVINLSRFLRPEGLVVFTLKTPGAETVSEMIELFNDVVAGATAAGLRLIAKTHLTYNRQEFTLFFERA